MSFSKKLLALVAALAIGCLSMTSQAAVLYATSNTGGGAGSPGLSELYTINTTTGATTHIGAVGFAVNGLTWDATTGTLYGSARADTGLLTINTTTGAGSLVAGGFGTPAGGCGSSDRNVLLAANSSGSLFGWCDASFDDLQSIDKVTGVATRVGESGLGTGGHGMAFDNNGDLYLDQVGSINKINTVTGAAVFHGFIGSTAHHGDFNPDNNLYYGIDSFGPGNILAIHDLVGLSSSSSLTLDRNDIFTLAFAKGSTVPEPATLALMGLGLIGLGFNRRRKI